MNTPSRGCLLVPALLLLMAAPPAKDDGWAGADPDTWPRIAMVNRIEYTDSKHPVAGSGFLIDTGDGLVAATAKHVLRFFKSEAMDSVSFRDTLVRWEMYPKDKPDDATIVGKLINEDDDEPLEKSTAATDWLLFTVEKASESVKPLRLRTTPLQPNETVFVVGWRYTDKGRQHVRRGRYVRSEKGSVLIDVPELRDNTVPGLSGTPVIDARGRVIGPMSSKAGKLQRVAGVEYGRALL